MKRLKQGDTIIAPKKINRNFTPGKEYLIHTIEYFEDEYSFEVKDNHGNIGWFYVSENITNKNKIWIARKEPVEVMLFRYFRYLCFSVVLFFLAILIYNIIKDLFK